MAVFSVSQVNAFIKNTIDAEAFFERMEIRGEISGFKISGGFAYFTLKDEKTQLACVAFQTANLYKPKDGESVVLTGKIDYYERMGKLSVRVYRITPAGTGALYEKFQKLKESLTKEGLFDESHKKPIPAFPKRIGVITAKTGAVIRDIIHVTRRRNPYVDLVLYPVKVQGEGAAQQIAQALAQMDTLGFDVLIVARGGGSLEDLEPFYTETVVRAVYQTKTPVISAVGHETDFSLCDLAADLRAPTPSAAAEVAVPEYKAVLRQVAAVQQRLAAAVLHNYTQQVHRLERCCQRLSDTMQNRTRFALQAVHALQMRLAHAAQRVWEKKQSDVAQLAARLDALNPLKVLQQGYAVVFKAGQRLRSVQELAPMERLTVKMADGEVEATVQQVHLSKP